MEVFVIHYKVTLATNESWFACYTRNNDKYYGYFVGIKYVQLRVILNTGNVVINVVCDGSNTLLSVMEWSQHKIEHYNEKFHKSEAN